MRALFTLFLLLFLWGCVASPPTIYNTSKSCDYYEEIYPFWDSGKITSLYSYEDEHRLIDLKRVADKIARKLCPSIQNDRVVLTEVVDEVELKSIYPFSFMFKNYLKNALVNDCHCKEILEVALTKNLNYSAQGVHFLSRDVWKLLDREVDAQKIILLRYGFTPDRVTIYANVVEEGDRAIICSALEELPMTCELLYLLSD